MIHNRLRNRRKELGFSQEDMSKKLGITRQGYGHYETGRNEPDSDTIKKLSEILDISTDYLLGATETPINNGTTTKYDPIAHLNEKFDELGIKDAGFYDYEKWKNLNREEVEEVIKHFEYVVHKAEERKRNKKNI